jgi:hypothetical protein
LKNAFLIFGLLLAGCASYGVVDNVPQTAAGAADDYSIRSHGGGRGTGDLPLLLAFSGGGTPPPRWRMA